ncbi:MAG: efflux transporter outer membrane subunit [Xanthobacteraceae bacterium]|jgi:outer membrane protein, multidrug efflux system
MFKARGPAVLGTSARRFVALALGLLLAPMLSGCIPKFERPDLVSLLVPPTYRAGPRDPEAALPALDWWRSFHSFELTRFIEEAQTANLDVGAAMGRIMQADAQAKITGAPLLPMLDFEGFGSRSKAPGKSDVGEYRGALNASYEIDFWGKNRALSRAAEESAVNARFNKEVVVLSTIVSVGTAYLNILVSQDRLRIAQENLVAATRILTLIRQRAQAGTASDLDVAQQESLVATVRASIPAFDQTLRQNIAVLAVLMGRAPQDLLVKGGSLYALTIPRVTPGLPSQLLLQRPDIRAAETNLASAEASIEAARAAFFPTISLSAQGGYDATVFRLLLTPQTAFYNVAVNISQPIFDGLRLQGNLELQQGRQFEFLKAYCQSILAGFRDVEIALIAIDDEAKRERLLSVAVASSRRAFALAETRLREGVADLVVVLQTQQTLFTNEDALVLSRLARLQAVLSLYQALGGSWFPPGVGVGFVLR